MRNANGPLGVCNARVRVWVPRMTAPPPYEPAEPMDPKDLPPGFYFEPGTEPGARQKRPPGAVWLLVAIAVIVVVILVAAGFWLF